MKKLIGILLCALTLFGMISCFKKEPMEAFADYDEIITTYQSLLLCKKNGNEPPESNDDAKVKINNRGKEIADALHKIVQDCKDPTVMGYATKDINRDGTDELVLMSRDCKLHALFTLNDGKPVLLLQMGTVAAIDTDGKVYSSFAVKKDEKVAQHGTIVKTLVDGKLEGLEFGSDVTGETTSYYKIENGVRSEITSTEKQALDDSIKRVIMNPFYMTKRMGFRFIPALTDDTKPNNAPVADFSTYNKILSAYEKIVARYAEYTQEKWMNGEFDGLYSFTDNESYDVFNKLFYAGATHRPTKERWGTEYAPDGNNAYGYAKKDLNGDGVEELILLTDQYDILALFTLKDGKAVLLDGEGSFWIDSEGRLYCSRSTGGTVDRDGEVFLYEIRDGSLHCVFGLGYKVNIYLQKGNWYKIEGNAKTELSKEEGEALYAQYDVLTDNFYSENEYTRTYAGLDFIPLFQSTSPKEISYHRTYMSEKGLHILSTKGNKITFSMDYYKYNELTLIYETVISGDAILQNGEYTFDNGTYGGKLVFGVNCAWVILTKSQDEHVECQAFLFPYIDENDS